MVIRYKIRGNHKCMFDTHCHLNFKTFEGKVEEIIEKARDVGINYFVIPGTDIETSKKAVKIAEKFEGVYAAVGIHPHHVYKKLKTQSSNVKDKKSGKSHPEFISGSDFRKQMLNQVQHDIQEIEKLLTNNKVVAVGEVGLDRHIYKQTVYQRYQVNKDFIKLQKLFFIEQIKLAYKYKKTLIIHNREAKEDLLNILTTNYSLLSTNLVVFHCCEPDNELLEFAKKHKIYIGVDGDVTYRKDKQDFIKKIPQEMLVLETDSPFLLPWPLKSQINEPKNLNLIASSIATQTGTSRNKLVRITEENSKKLFQIS